MEKYENMRINFRRRLKELLNPNYERAQIVISTLDEYSTGILKRSKSGLSVRYLNMDLNIYVKPN